MKSKDGLEFGTQVTIFEEHATVWDLCNNNASVIKVLMKNGRFAGSVMIAVLSKVKLGWQ